MGGEFDPDVDSLSSVRLVAGGKLQVLQGSIVSRDMVFVGVCERGGGTGQRG